MGEITIIVLAAGEGKRMRSATPKVLHSMLGRTLVGHVLHAADAVGAHQTLVVVGHGAEAVTAHIGDIAPKAQTVELGVVCSTVCAQVWPRSSER